MTAFYEQIWNGGVLDAASRLLTLDSRFRGSLGSELQGQPAFLDYVRSVRAALAEYRCEIVACVAEEDRAFARMRFSGRHVGPLLGHAATGRPVQSGAPFSLRVERAGNTLALVVPNGVRYSLMALSSTRFAAPSLQPGFELRAVLEGDRVAALEFRFPGQPPERMVRTP